jgi:hypothetical protein
MEKIFFKIDNEDFVVHLIKNDHWKEGEVYPIYKYTDSDEWGYQSDQDGMPTDDAKEARCLFKFLFCWRGVWEGRIYFKDDEYWCEQLATINKLWNAIEVKMKDRIKQQNPDNTYDA